MTYLVLGIIGAFVGAVVASGKNRNAVGWAALGFLFPVLGVIAICCLPAEKSADELAMGTQTR